MKPGRNPSRAPKGRPPISTGALRGNPRGSLHRGVAQDIGARILNGEFAPGTLLPNEAEWCQRFGVSRTIVRAARYQPSGSMKPVAISFSIESATTSAFPS